MNLEILYKDYEKILAAIENTDAFDGPTLFIKGGRSEYVQPEDKSTIQSLFPNAQLARVADAGHWVHAEKPKELLALIRQMLTG